MADDGDRDPLRWVVDYLRGLAASAALPAAIPIDAGARWRVEERTEGRFDVMREGERPGAEPDASFDDRQIAYVAAAVFTAFGGVPASGEDLIGAAGLPAAGREVREPQWDWESQSVDEGVVQRLLAGLMGNPAALELLLEAVDPEVLEEAQSIVMDRLIQRGGGQIH
jgi:hypothetical protein